MEFLHQGAIQKVHSTLGGMAIFVTICNGGGGVIALLLCNSVFS